VDHVEPIDKQVAAKKYILMIMDAFSRFVRLYAKTTSSREAMTCLANHFQCYNTSKILLSNRDGCFVSNHFKEFLKQHEVS